MRLGGVAVKLSRRKTAGVIFCTVGKSHRIVRCGDDRADPLG
jgi:hypothetical protein